MAARPLLALQRCFSSTARKSFSTASPRRSGLPIPSAPANVARVGSGLEDFFDNEKGWAWSDTELPTGRAWLAAELRRKDFDDLHKLWWVCIKEQNKLYSQKEEARRFALYFPHKERLEQVKLTMNRIKQVIWERRIEWFRAQAVLKKEEKAAELRAQGMDKADIAKKLQELFPVPIEQIGRKPSKLKEEAKRKEIDLKGRGRRKKSDWYIV